MLFSSVVPIFMPIFVSAHSLYFTTDLQYLRSCYPEEQYAGCSQKKKEEEKENAACSKEGGSRAVGLMATMVATSSRDCAPPSTGSAATSFTGKWSTSDPDEQERKMKQG